MNFFITTLQSFLPIALLLGLNWSHRSTPTVRSLGWITLLALFVGTFIGVHFPNGQAFLLGFTALQALALLLFLVCQCFSHPRLGYLWQALLVAGAAVHWGNDPNLTALTTTHVVNTDLLLNFSAVLLAFGWLAFCAALCGMIARRIRLLRWPLLALLVALLLLPISGNLLLLLMKLQALGLTKPRLSYVAHVTNSAYLLNYLKRLVHGGVGCPGWFGRCGMRVARCWLRMRRLKSVKRQQAIARCAACCCRRSLRCWWWCWPSFIGIRSPRSRLVCQKLSP